MTKIKFTLLTAFFTFSLFYTHAQNVGFMGKKTSIGVGASILPSFANMLIGNESQVIDDLNHRLLDYPKFKFIAVPKISISRTLGRIFDISATVAYQRQNMYMPSKGFDQYYNNYSSTSYEYFNKKGNNVQFKALSVDIDAKIYFSSYIAPAGAYLKFGFGQYYASVIDGDSIQGGLYSQQTYNHFTKVQDYNIVNQTTKFTKFNAGIHQKKVFSKSFYGDLGVDATIIFHSSAEKFDRYTYNLNSTTINSGYYPSYMKMYLNKSNIISISLTFGYIF